MLEDSYPSAEMQSGYSTVLAHWVVYKKGTVKTYNQFIIVNVSEF